jgi:hypothetical protein
VSVFVKVSVFGIIYGCCCELKDGSRDIKAHKSLENRPLLKVFAPKKWGRVVRERGRAFGEMGRTPRETGRTVGEMGRMLREMGRGLGEMGRMLREMGRVVGETGRTLGDWGGCPGKWGATVSRRPWGMEILWSGCERFARWLAKRLPTDARFCMGCGRRF